MKKILLAVLVMLMAVSMAAAEEWIEVYHNKKADGTEKQTFVDADSITKRNGYASARIKTRHVDGNGETLKVLKSQFGDQTAYWVMAIVVDSDGVYYRQQGFRLAGYSANGKLLKSMGPFALKESNWVNVGSVGEEGEGPSYCKYILEHQK